MLEAWEEAFTVRSFDVDRWGVLAPPALLAWMLEAAGQHAVRLGWGIQDLQRRGLTWMLSRFGLVITALPAWGDTVTIRTWPSGVVRLFATRELQLLDQSGELMARASSAWLLLDRRTRRPLRPGPELASLAETTPRRGEEGGVEALPELGAASDGATFKARVFDLDVNGHVTAAALTRWVLESLPAPLLLEQQLRSLDLEFRAEVLLGEEVAGEYETRHGIVLARLRRLSDGREVVRSRSTLGAL